MNKLDKVFIWKAAAVIFGVTSVVQSIAGTVVIKHYEKEAEKHEATWKGGKYFISLLEQEGYQFTKFDELALEAFKPNP